MAIEMVRKSPDASQNCTNRLPVHVCEWSKGLVPFLRSIFSLSLSRSFSSSRISLKSIYEKEGRNPE